MAGGARFLPKWHTICSYIFFCLTFKDWPVEYR
jgi:hypothetical protein